MPRQRPLRWDELAVIEQRAGWEKSTEARDEVSEQALTAAVQHPRPPIDQLARQWLRAAAGRVRQGPHIPDGSGRFRLVGRAPAGHGRRLFQRFHLITVVHSLREEDGRGGSLWHGRNSTRESREARTRGYWPFRRAPVSLLLQVCAPGTSLARQKSSTSKVEKHRHEV